MKTEYVIGRRAVLECLRAGKRSAHRLYLLRDGKGLEEILKAAGGLTVERTGRQELNQLADGVHQGVVLDADPLPVLKVEEWAKGDFAEDAVVVVLDGIEDPQNLGAIVRSAVACGAAGIVLGKDRAAPLSAAAVKSAAGAMEYIDLVRATNLVRALDRLKEAGFWVAGLDGAAKQTLWQADLGGRVALVIGGEGKGLRRLVRERCDFHVRIPTIGAVKTLNASVSAAIALAECLRRRSQVS